MIKIKHNSRKEKDIINFKNGSCLKVLKAKRSYRPDDITIYTVDKEIKQ